MLDECVDFESYKLRVLKNCKLTNLLQIDELDLICKICATLRENNIQLIERIVHRKGSEFCQKILDLTLETLEYGGQNRQDGTKRTPGGVFINILKKHLNKSEIKFIWNEQLRKMEEKVEKAIRLSKQAIELDYNKEYKRSLNLYIKALDQWALVCKNEKDNSLRDKYFKKMKEYLERAEHLKSVLGSNNNSNDTTSTNKDNKEDNNNTNNSKNKHNNDNMFDEFESSLTILKPDVKWDDVAGLKKAKLALQEAVLLPIKFPNLFRNKLKPYSCILLYGPPGTGKTYLAQALATEFESTFIQVSSSDVMSKWLGDSEKYIKKLFEFARKRKPSVIFIDEIDSMCSKRTENEHESTRRIKTELLIQVQRILDENKNLLLLGSTNMPWLLDTAILRRFEKRIYVPLPDDDTRIELINKLLQDIKHELKEEDIQNLSNRTENFNCFDINVLVKEILIHSLKKCNNNNNLLNINENELTIPVITNVEVNEVLETFKPSVVTSDLNLFNEWTLQYGQLGSG